MSPTVGPVSSEEQCGAVAGACRCQLDPHETGPHVCACEGSWEVRDGRLIALATPRLNVETGEQVEGYDPDPVRMTANLRALEAARLVRMGVDPLTAQMIAAGLPLTASRGGIRFINPPTAGEGTT